MNFEQGLQEEPLLAVFHPVALEEPLILALSGVECVSQQPPHLQRKAWAQLLQTSLLPILCENVPVPSHKYEVALVVEGDHVPAYEFGLVREHGAKQASHSMPQASVKIVQNNLWNMACRSTRPFDLVPQFFGGKLEACCRAVWKVYNHKPAAGSR